MILTYHVSVEVPDFDNKNWSAFIKAQLLKFGWPPYYVKSVVPLDDFNPQIAEAMEQEADDRGELPS